MAIFYVNNYIWFIVYDNFFVENIELDYKKVIYDKIDVDVYSFLEWPGQKKLYLKNLIKLSY